MHHKKRSSESKKHHFLTRKSMFSSLGAGLSLVSIAVIAAFIMSIIGPAKTNYAAQYLGCSPNGYIIRDNSTHTDFQSIDMVTGKGVPAGQVTSRNLNAIGYNPKDNHFYAWDLTGGVFVKVSSDLSTTTAFAPGNGMAGYSGTTNDIFSGDVDTDGHYWFFVGSNWYEADLNTGTPAIIGSGTAAPSSGTNGTDWAFVPGTNKLYRGMDQSGVIHIWSFDRTSHAYNDEGAASNISTTTDGDMGAVYADPNGNFYMSSHNSGKLFRVDLSESPNFTATELDAVAPSSNDGARCALASIPVDLGDAPQSYGTAIADDGPRHSIIDFNVATSTAPLMLGTNIDIEEDGLPSSGADNDDNNHEGLNGAAYVDDERGVTQIVATQASSDPITVPVRVTNTTSSTATLAGWIDLDNDGLFETGERVTATVAAGFTGYQNLTFPAPATPYSVSTYARFRLFSTNDTSLAATSVLPTGPALGGEVEDVRVQLGTYDVSKTADPADGTIVDPGAVVTYTLAIKNTGSTPLTNLKIDDDLTDILDDATLQGTPTVNPGSAGSAYVNGNTLEFLGDVSAGATVTVTYAIKVKDGGTLGNAALNNYVLATHSTSCSPAINGSGSATVNDPDCSTNNSVGGLANTGTNIFVPILLSFSLIVASATIWYAGSHRNRHFRRSL
jgi:uncharacterized repeat protein (TIGR01451 family)